MKYWINDKGNDKLIVIANGILYNYNPSQIQLNEYKNELQRGKIPKKLTGTPINYFTKVSTDNRSKKTVILYGENNELELDTRENHLAILDYLREDDLRNPKYTEYIESIYSAVKKPVIALLLIIFFTVYSYGIAEVLEYGRSSIITGGEVIGIFLGLAEILGRKGIRLLGNGLALIPIWLIWRNVRFRRTIYELNYKMY